MALAQTYRSQVGPFRGDRRPFFNRNYHRLVANAAPAINNSYNIPNNFSFNNDYSYDISSNFWEHNSYSRYAEAEVPATKRRRTSTSGCESSMRPYIQPCTYKNGPSDNRNSSVCMGSVRPYTDTNQPPSCKRDRSKFEDEDLVFMSRDEIERCSPSRKDGIDAVQETRLRYSYCHFLQNLGIQLEIPQTTIGTAMVLCHRFFVRKSHACHDRFLISTAALFLAAKSEESACPLNNVLRASCEILHNQDFDLLLYRFPVGWFEQYRERVIEAEQIILTTLNFELNVQHPYASLTSTLDKLGLSQSLLVNLALSLVSEGLRSSLWLQFKPHQIAAGAAYLAAKSMNMDLTSSQHLWQEFQTPPSILKDVVQQLTELF
ncbi:CYCLIN domain-containing protein [Heracleum sosnowskyi]|uniref:CYCLIN domain-containing protein n=1 Tax=Heracleum sosnowskyi TaxID=360622 RepID=A0AAD8J3D9_9APIA|nr:CYCLIN domain-containing protein [Heracleum sosnowskyi]